MHDAAASCREPKVCLLLAVRIVTDAGVLKAEPVSALMGASSRTFARIDKLDSYLGSELKMESNKYSTISST